jgi:hypothetical protein
VNVEVRCERKGPVGGMQIQQATALDQEVKPNHTSAPEREKIDNGNIVVSVNKIFEDGGRGDWIEKLLLSRMHVTLALVSMFRVDATMTLETYRSPTDQAYRGVERERITPFTRQRSIELSK